MKRPGMIFAVFIFTMAGRAFGDISDWDDIETKREISYESYGRSSGVTSHKWKLALSQKWGMKAGAYLIKNESPASSIETHMLGFYGSRNFRLAGLRASYALRDRSLSGAKGTNFLSGGLRLTPFKTIDLLLNYDRVQDEFITGDEDLEKEALSAGLKIKVSAFRMKLSYSGKKLMRVRVSYGW